MKQLTTNTAKELKQRLFEEQDGCCLLCGCELNPDVMKNHLDHDHALDGNNAGRVRGLLCILCNPLDGIVLQKFNRSGLVSKKIEYIKWLENYIEYLKKDYSENDFHPNFIPDTIKRFKRLSLPEMRDELTVRGYVYQDKDTKSELVKIFGKQFRKEQKSL